MTKPSAGALRAVDYLRVSTEEQARGYGIAYTGKKTARYIQRKGWEHVGTYADEGVSGSLQASERDDLSRLMAEARRIPRPFDMVVVNEGRAIGRAGRAFWPWVWELEDLGIYVAVVKDDYDNSTPSGRSRMRKDADYAEEERENIRARTQAGIQEKAEDGGWPGGQPRYGYRIENKGIKGEQRLIVDDCDGGDACSRTALCATLHEAPVLRRARELAVKHRGNWRRVALGLNAEGMVTRSGRPWRYANIRARLMDEDLLQARYVFRSAKSAALDQSGRPLWGESVTIPLDPIFTPDEIAALRAAISGPRRAAATPARTYILSGRIFSPCGKHYVGWGQVAEGTRYYRCAGKTEAYAGASVCDCSLLNAGVVEEWAWNAVRDLLGDADRLQALAREWVGRMAGQQVDFAGRLVELDRQIAEQDDAMAVTTAVAARQAARRGLTGAEAEAAVERALKPLQDEVAELEKMRAEVLAWQEEAEQAEQRARDFQALADMAHRRLDNLTPERQANYLAVLNVRIAVTGPPPPMRKGVACPVGQWFRENGRLVPEFSDGLWSQVEDLMPVTRGLHPRVMLKAFLCKARCGASWPELEALYGSSRLRVHWRRWTASGLWGRVMERLEGEGGTPPIEPPRLPPMHLKGDIRPGVILAASEGHSSASGPWERSTNVTYRFSMSLAS